jgi:uncharacterized protein (DUF2461 family)
MRLGVHLEDHEPVMIRKPRGAPVSDAALANAALRNQPLSTLTAYHRAVADPNINTTGVVYPDIHLCCSWKPGVGWQQRGARPKKTTARMMEINPKRGDVYYKRMLLKHVADCANEKQLRTFNGVEHVTHKDACIARGLLRGDQEYME